jgi:hypothetical protein
MGRRVAGLAAVVLALALAGCSGSGSASSPSPAGSGPAPPSHDQLRAALLTAADVGPDYTNQSAPEQDQADTADITGRAKCQRGLDAFSVSVAAKDPKQATASFTRSGSLDVDEVLRVTGADPAGDFQAIRLGLRACHLVRETQQGSRQIVTTVPQRLPALGAERYAITMTVKLTGVAVPQVTTTGQLIMVRVGRVICLIGRSGLQPVSIKDTIALAQKAIAKLPAG